MKTYSGTTADGKAIQYVDRRRWLWLLSLLYPLQPIVGIALHAAMENPVWVVLPLISTYLLSPLVDWVIGTDHSNPPDELSLSIERDLYFRRLTFAAVPLHYLSFFATVVYCTTQPVQASAFVALAVLAGVTAGLAINTGHELGHKNSVLEKRLAKIVLALPAYGHFSIDHNRGHHKNVATFEDTSSARMGESIYAFALREIPGSIANAWALEKERLNSRGLPAWHPKNSILQSYSLSLAIAVVLFAALGWKVIPFLLIHHALAYWQLTSANYIEHYGLLRTRDDSGKVEKCQPHHSWNSDHIFTNSILFNLQRHSDHHTQPLRRYQALKSFDDLPSLPSGYIGMYVLAYVPWLWFKVMDPRLMGLPHVDGDLDNVNMDPVAQPSLFLRWGRDKMAEPTYTGLPGI